MTETVVEACDAVTDLGGGSFSGSATEWLYLAAVFGGGLPTTDATHKTQGTTAWKLTAYDVGGSTFVISALSSALDLSSYVSLKVDYYIEAIGGSDKLFLGVGSGNDDDVSVSTIAGVTGAGTLNVSLTGVVNKPETTVAISLNEGGSGTSTATIHIDNIRGVAAVTEVIGTLAATEAADTLASTASIAQAPVTGSLAATEAADTLSAEGIGERTATAAITEAADTVSSFGSETAGRVGNLAATEAADTVSSAGALAISGTLAATENADTLTASSAVPITATAAVTEAADTLAAIGARARTATLAATETADTLSAAGSITDFVPGSLGRARAKATARSSASAKATAA